MDVTQPGGSKACPLSPEPVLCSFFLIRGWILSFFDILNRHPNYNTDENSSSAWEKGAGGWSRAPKYPFSGFLCSVRSSSGLHVSGISERVSERECAPTHIYAPTRMHACVHTHV